SIDRSRVVLSGVEVEGAGEQLGERTGFDVAGVVEEQDAGTVAGELGELLAAAAAGRAGAGRVAAADHGDGCDTAAAGDDHRGDGVGLGAGPFGKRGILDVAADVDAPDLVQHRGADAETGIGRVRVAARVARDLDQPFVVHVIRPTSMSRASGSGGCTTRSPSNPGEPRSWPCAAPASPGRCRAARPCRGRTG